MKQRTQWIAALLTAASASLAMAAEFYSSDLNCGYYSERLQPVREQIVERKITYVQQPVMIKRTTTCVMEPRSAYWSEPVSPVAAVGNVIAAPFRLIGSGLAWTGRTLSGGEPAYVGSSRAYIEPVGEQVTTVTTQSTMHHKYLLRKHHLRKSLSYRSEVLMPVGERFTTTKVIRSRTLEPVGERFTTMKVVRTRPILEPVGERFTTVKVIHTRPVLKPVGERIITTRHIRMEPVGERVILRRIYVQPSSNWCDF